LEARGLLGFAAHLKRTHRLLKVWIVGVEVVQHRRSEAEIVIGGVVRKAVDDALDFEPAVLLVADPDAETLLSGLPSRRRGLGPAKRVEVARVSLT